MKLHASGEDYLEAILVLQRQKGMVRSVDVARHLEVTKPSVCNAPAAQGYHRKPSRAKEDSPLFVASPPKYLTFIHTECIV